MMSNSNEISLHNCLTIQELLVASLPNLVQVSSQQTKMLMSPHHSRYINNGNDGTQLSTW